MTEPKNLRKILYTPSGRAGAYANGGYAANIYKGCTHRCQYCYVPSFCHVDRTEFHDHVEVAPNVLERMDRQLAAHKKSGKVISEPVFMCFTTDPYPEDDTLSMLTAEVIKLINSYDIPVNILTKGGLRAARDFYLLAAHPGNKIGTTLTFWDASKSAIWEPGAASPRERIEMLEEAKSYHIQTWASVEPVIMPSQSLQIMKAALHCVDVYKIGKWNHDARANGINWTRFLGDARELMIDNGKTHVIKQDLLDAAEKQ